MDSPNMILKKDFFVKNYFEPIIENGIMLRDMIMLNQIFEKVLLLTLVFKKQKVLILLRTFYVDTIVSGTK